jgi:hypothetical protein
MPTKHAGAPAFQKNVTDEENPIVETPCHQ